MIGDLGVTAAACLAANQDNSKHASQNLEPKKREDAGVERGRPITGRNHEDIVPRRVQEVLVKIGAHGGQKENQ